MLINIFQGQFIVLCSSKSLTVMLECLLPKYYFLTHSSKFNYKELKLHPSKLNE